MAKDIRPVRPNPRPVYKLTDQNMRTYNGYQWELDKLYQVSGEGPLCAPGWLHAYSHPDLAILLNPIHADYQPPKLFEAVPSGIYLSDSSLKVGVSGLRLTKELPLPTFTHLDYVVWAIFVVRAIPNREPIPLWDSWADKLLTDRIIDVTRAAAWAAAWAAQTATWAAWAAKSAAQAAGTARVARAAQAAARAAQAAAQAAQTAAWAAQTAQTARAAESAEANFSLLKPHQQFLEWRDHV